MIERRLLEQRGARDASHFLLWRNDRVRFEEGGRDRNQRARETFEFALTKQLREAGERGVEPAGLQVGDEVENRGDDVDTGRTSLRVHSLSNAAMAIGNGCSTSGSSLALSELGNRSTTR